MCIRDSNYIKSTLSMSPVMPVLTINNIDNVEYLFEALINGNLKVVEITLRTDCALKAIEIASKKFPSLKIGAGTVLNNEDLNSVKDAGAKFAVSPGSTISLATHALEKEFPFLPGVSNSSDIMNLMNLDYKFFKFFPAQAAGGLEYLKSLSGPFPEILFCPTGGINQNNAHEWLSQKNVICVGGSWIIPPESRDYKEITKRALLASSLSCLLYTSPSPRDRTRSRMPSSA